MSVEYLTNHIFVLSYWRFSDKAPSWKKGFFGGDLPIVSSENMAPLFRRLYDKHTVQTVDNPYGFTTEAAYRIEACLERLIDREVLENSQTSRDTEAE